MIPLIYLAGPYSAPNSHVIFENCTSAIAIAQQVIELGAYPVLSHALGLFCQDGCGQGYDWWCAATKLQMLRCDAVLMLPGWQGSNGAIGEHAAAVAADMPVFTMVRELPTFIKGFGK